MCETGVRLLSQTHAAAVKTKYTDQLQKMKFETGLDLLLVCHFMACFLSLHNTVFNKITTWGNTMRKFDSKVWCHLSKGKRDHVQSLLLNQPWQGDQDLLSFILWQQCWKCHEILILKKNVLFFFMWEERENHYDNYMLHVN